tara:strand:+ start:207 stop:761 length:555 start_codon:yes stop_codon:yes gene_type:complete
MSYLPIDLMTSEIRARRRLKVENDDPSYELGTQFRISYPLTVSSSTAVTIRFISPVNFELIEQGLESHQSGFTLEAFRSAQGSPTGVFDSQVPVYKNNSQTTATTYDRQVSVDTGGGFTQDEGQTAVETLNVLSASSTAQRTTSFAGSNGKRGLPAGTYYLRFTKLGGAGDSLGVFSLIFDERP